ncbi:unnamed protein product [Caenorhabditis sp. 36 PRJEB53466]|nr:unnamed protein product [Caenorhabditis sp. 36 PRJEB53466]
MLGFSGWDRGNCFLVVLCFQLVEYTNSFNIHYQWLHVIIFIILKKIEQMDNQMEELTSIAVAGEVSNTNERGPTDKFRLVFSIILLNGIGVLLPWNMFITIAPQYYVDYWFTVNGTKTGYADNFMSAMGIVAQDLFYTE